MPQLTFPITPDGLCVDVRVNLDAAALLDLWNAGLPGPASVPARALIDTGSDLSVVAPSILSRLALPPVSQARTQAFGGSVWVSLFEVSITILEAAQSGPPGFVSPRLLVMEMTSPLAFDVLIGMDVLLGCRLLIDGPGRQFMIDY